MKPRLVADGVSKKFCRDLRLGLTYGMRDIGRELAGRGASSGLRPGEFWSLDNVSFELLPGQALAVMGANGAGKTTLLRIVAGLLKPDQGEVRVRGRISALIELGAGLNPLLTGRENIEIAAALQGVGGRALGRLTERVLDFSELEEVVDSPFQSYSTGMRARLAYALATQIDPDILLVDEVLAVGDLAFQRKCFEHLHAFLAGGGALLLVSHNPYQTQAICRSGLLLDRGRVAFQGSAVDTVHHILQSLPEDEPPAADEGGTGPVRISGLALAGEGGGAVAARAPLRLTLSCTAEAPVEIVWGFSIWSSDNNVCISSAYDMRPRRLGEGPAELGCTVADPRLVGGRYRVRGTIVDHATLQPLAVHGQERGVALDVPTEPDLVRNAQLRQGQLVEIDVDWD
ncbi:MAG TPA: ABC transporter ATP-binding protein [Allosphingosinicella sp.]|jgi:ABC-type polysaccharide/polyol phosphate transport system ATPase subunit